MYKYGPFDVEVTIRGGFPLRAKGCVCKPEYDTGLSTRIEDLWVTTIRGGNADFLKITHREEIDIEEQVWDKVRYDGDY